jgi:membrane associated rhomboid family serine protease
LPLSPRLRWKLDRLRENLSGLFGGKKEEARPKLCPACSQLVGATQTRCHQCGTSLTFSLAAIGKSLGGLIPTTSPVTSVMIGVNLLIYGVCLLATIQASDAINIFGGINGQVLEHLGSRETYLILQGEWWRLVMPIFLHGSLMHIGFNCYVLWDCGTQVEEVYGSARTLFLYVATGVLSFVWSTMWDLLPPERYTASVGASGALMGLVGLMLAIASRRGGAYMREIRAGLIRWIVMIFALGFLMGGIDNAAHFGGLVAGYALGHVFDDREPQTGPERKRAYLLGTAAFLVVVGSFAAMMLHNYRAAP